MRRILCALVTLLIFLYGCSKDSSTNSPPAPGTLLLSRVIVSLVPGSSETISICSAKNDGQYDACTFTNSDPDVASAVISDSTLTITGHSYGTTNITIKSAAGLTRTLPVHTYSPYALETADLYITFVDTFDLRWNDLGSGGDNDGSFYHPITSYGFRAIGSLGLGPNGYPNPNGLYAMMVIKAKPGHEDAVAEPVGYELIYNDRGSGAYMDGSFWRPIPPDGYTALGTVVADNTWNQPSLSDVVCVRSDLAMIGETADADFIYNDAGTGADMYLGCWKIDQPTVGPHDYAYLKTGTFVAEGNWSRPSTDPVMYVLKVDLPTLAEAPNQEFAPKLTDYDAPPEETVPIMGKAMLVPCSIINDLAYDDNIRWQVANSPMYRLERQVFYKLLYHNHNQTSQIQTNNVAITSGITTTEAQRIWTETEIQISVEMGLEIEPVSAKVTATVSQKFGYETQTSVAELQQKQVTSSINTPPGKAAALWQKYNRYILYRHNGTSLEPVSSWEFGIDSYITDEFPN